MELCYANTDNLFKKYSKLVTWFGNTDIGKSYLSGQGIKIEGKIGLILPNGFIQVHLVHKDKIEATLHASTKDILIPKLDLALQAVDFFQYHLNSFDEAREILKWQLGFGKIPTIAKYFHFRQLIAFPSSSQTNTVDGRVGNQTAGQSWSNKVTGSGTAAVYTGAGQDVPNVIANTSSNLWDELWRYIVLFDTSALTSSATIQNTSKISIFVTATTQNIASQSVNIVTSTPATNTALVAADYSQLGTTRQATDITVASLATSVYDDWVLNATGDGNISKTSISKFGASFASDIDNSSPTWVSGAQTRLAPYFAAGTSPTKITVNYTLPGDGVTAGNYSFIM